MNIVRKLYIKMVVLIAASVNQKFWEKKHWSSQFETIIMQCQGVMALQSYGHNSGSYLIHLYALKLWWFYVELNWIESFK